MVVMLTTLGGGRRAAGRQVLRSSDIVRATRRGAAPALGSPRVASDGTGYRGVRDYAEAGLSKTFRLAPGASLQASFRFHRIERHYEYSYRIVAIANVRTRLK